jgi:hypothetical protein
MSNEVIQQGETLAVGFWTKHRRLCIEIAMALLLLFGGFVSGRFTKQAVVETKVVTKTEVQTKTVVQYQDRVQIQKVYVSTEKKHLHTVETTTKKPDGTVTTTKTTDDNEDDSQNAQVNKTDQKNQTSTQTQIVTQTVFKDKLVLQQPNWSVYAGVGFDVFTFLGDGQNGIPGMKGFVVQAGVDRRVAGAFWIGVFGNTEGVLGLNLRATW